MYYFGTNLDEAGHYFWKVNEDRLEYIGCDFPNFRNRQVCEWPFNPEDMPYRINKSEYLPLGHVAYYREAGYSICAIEGSCRDKRLASKSVFYVEGDIKFGELVLEIMSTNITRQIIKAMPFQVKWGLNEEYSKKLNDVINGQI